MDPRPEIGPALRGYAFAATSALASALATVVGKWNLTAVSPLVLNCLIFSIATGFLTFVVLFSKQNRNLFQHTGRGWIWLGLFSLSSVFALWFFWAGVQQMDPSLAAFLNRAEVLLAILLGVILLRERFTGAEGLGAAISVAGILIMRLSLRMEYTLGFWYVLAGAVFFALAELFSKLAVRFIEPLLLTYLRSLFMAIVFWLALLGTGASFRGLDRVWPGIVALGFLGPVSARMTYLFALKHLDLSKVAVIGQTQPVFVLLIAFLALGELPTVRETLGGFLLLSGCLVMVAARSRYRTPRSQLGR
jgi:drug/metabolite transporter (DMT)-like permease